MKKYVLSVKLTCFRNWKQIILALLFIIAVVFLYDGFKKTKETAIETVSTQHSVYSNQIVSEICFKFELIRNVLELWSSSSEILHMSDETVPCMERILAAHSSYISGVTRMDENGIIRYTVPYYEGAVGADISSQEHIQQLMETHQAAISDAFMTVQGYWAIAYHVPCFDKDGSFSGSLAFLVPFREMFRKLFVQSMPDENTVILVLSSEGLILFSPVQEHEGRNYTEVFTGSSGEMSVVDAALAGYSGYMLTDFRTFVKDQNKPETMLSTIVPFSFQGITWFLIVSEPEASIMKNISGLSNRWLGGMLAIILLALIYSSLKIRTRITSKEEKKWENVSRLKDVLIRTVNQAGEVIIILDNKERIIYANRAAVKVSGFGKEFLNKRISQVPFKDKQPRISEVRKTVVKKGHWKGIFNARGAKNRFLKLDSSVSSIIGIDGTITNFIIIARDVTVQAEMERRLREQQKMESIGQLAGGIAHDFNNLLVGVLGYAELLKEHYPQDGEVTKAADVIITAVHQGSELTKQLLGFARRGKHQIAKVDIGRCVRNITILLKRTLDKRIKVIHDLEENVYVKGDYSQIEQVVLNLAVNARDAMPTGGELKFTLKREIVSAAIIDGKSQSTPREFAVLKTADTGSGISRKYIDRIFEPFFTTKDEDGTGMGLATVYGIVVNHGGWVDVDTEPGEGTIFTVYFPTYEGEDKQEIKESGSLSEFTKRLNGTVLVVDDESMVTATLTELLLETGFNVVSASKGERALELYSENPEAFDIIILDLSMPGMDGRECFIRLREINPRVKVILATGFSRNGRVQELLDMGVKGFLKKPFRLKELTDMLWELIDS